MDDILNLENIKSHLGAFLSQGLLLRRLELIEHLARINFAL